MARGRRAENEAAVENLALVAQTGVHRAPADLERLRREVGLAEVTAVARAEETRAERARFEAGRAKASDVLEIDSRQREAEVNRHRARTDARKAGTELLRVEGRLAEARGVEVF